MKYKMLQQETKWLLPKTTSKNVYFENDSKKYCAYAISS